MSLAATRTLVTHPELLSHHSLPGLPHGRRAAEECRSNACCRVFADVRAGEGAGALLLAVNVFLLLGSTTCCSRRARPDPHRRRLGWRSQLALFGRRHGGGAAGRGAALRLAGLARSPRPADRHHHRDLRRQRSSCSTWRGTPGARAAPFYIWLGVFNVFVVAQFWSFANDIYTEGQGRRLFPLIGVGASLGALGRRLQLWPARPRAWTSRRTR